MRTAAPHLNPADPADREKISREFNKFLRDPGRKYKGELARLEASNEDLVLENQEAARQLSKTRSDLEGLISQRDTELAAARSEIRARELRSSAFLRLGSIAILLVLVEVAVAYAAIQFGDGQNNFQKIKNAWEFLALPPTGTVALSWFVLGRDRIRALGWTFGKLLAGADD